MFPVDRQRRRRLYRFGKRQHSRSLVTIPEVRRRAHILLLHKQYWKSQEVFILLTWIQIEEKNWQRSLPNHWHYPSPRTNLSNWSCNGLDLPKSSPPLHSPPIRTNARALLEHLQMPFSIE